MGEAKELKKSDLALACQEAMVVDTLGGRMHVRWDDSAQATPHGQIAFFAEFLATAGVFDRWVDVCPLDYTSPNASSTRDVLGTLLLGILAGSRRYAHIAGVRGDAVAAQALGLQGIVSEDSVRRALKAMQPEASEPWMREALMASVRDALGRAWVLDMDATIKPLYGRQEGAEVGYNPHKPGRPSHVLHTFWIGNLRLVLDAVLTSGKQHTSKHGKAALVRLLDELGEKTPALVRGDCGYGNEDILDVCEQRELAYLLRLRQTANVKRLISDSLPNYGRRYRAGRRISSAFVESAVNQLIDKRMSKSQQMRWDPRSAHLLLQVRVRVVDGQLRDDFARWYPGFPSNASTMSSAA